MATGTPGPRMVRTPPDGRLIYVQADVEALVRALRVVPNWVTKMKRAVDEANT